MGEYEPIAGSSPRLGELGGGCEWGWKEEGREAWLWYVWGYKRWGWKV